MTEIRRIPPAAFDLARRQEQTFLFAYDDKRRYPPKAALPTDVILGTLTAGTGHTGPDVKVGMVVTPEMDAAWLLADLQEAAEKLEKKIGAVVDELTDNQYAALLDFVFNLGTGNPKKREWTIWKALRARQFDQVPGLMNEFVNWGSPPVKSQDLVDRRAAEVVLWAKGEPGTVAPKVPSSVTRAEPTPPTPADPKPLTKKPSLIAGAISAAAAAGPIAKEVSDGAATVSRQIAPFAEHSQYVQQVVGLLSAVAALGVTVTFGLMWLEHRNSQN